MAERTIKFSWLLLVGSLLFSQSMINRLKVPVIIKGKMGFGYDNNFQNTFLDLTAGYRHELLIDRPIGPFRPIFIVGTGGMSDLKSFSKDNIIGIWMIKYMLGLGIQFYNRRILNEFILKFSHSEAIQSHVAFQLGIYWKY